MEIIVTLEASALAEALNNLASAICKTKEQDAPATLVTPTVQQEQPAPVIAPQAVVAPAPAPAPTAVVSAPQVAQVQAPIAPQTVSTVPLAQAPQYTAEQIMSAGAALMDAGKSGDLINLLHNFGVQAVTELKAEQYGAFATAMRGLGAKI